MTCRDLGRDTASPEIELRSPSFHLYSSLLEAVA